MLENMTLFSANYACENLRDNRFVAAGGASSCLPFMPELQ